MIVIALIVVGWVLFCAVVVGIFHIATRTIAPPDPWDADQVTADIHALVNEIEAVLEHEAER
jgi:hypothetical protein